MPTPPARTDPDPSPAPDTAATTVYALEPVAARSARRHTRTLLRAWQVQEHTIWRAEQIVGELVANAVRHAAPNPWHPELAELHEAARPSAAWALGAGACITLTVTLGIDHVMVEVDDPSPARPYVPARTSMLMMDDYGRCHPQEWARGLNVVQALAEVWGARGAGDYQGPTRGKTVWAAVALEENWSAMTYVVRAAGS